MLEFHRFLSVPLEALIAQLPDAGFWGMLALPINKVIVPLLLNKWFVIPLLLIILMQFRPEGLLGHRELTDVFPKLRQWFSPKEEEV